MTVKFVTHSLKTGDITVMGQVRDVAKVRGSKVSRIGAVEGQEQQNPAAIHINFEGANNADESLVVVLNVPDAMELGLQLLAMGVEGQASRDIDGVRDRLIQLVAELDQSLQVSHSVPD